MAPTQLQPLIDLRGAGTSLTPQRARRLHALDAQGSISAAARSVGMSYKGAWDAVAALNTFLGEPLVSAETGGSGGGGACWPSTKRSPNCSIGYWRDRARRPAPMISTNS